MTELAGTIIRLWQKAPLRWRKGLVNLPLASAVRRLANRLYSDEPRIFQLTGPLAGQRMRLHWPAQKAMVFATYEPEVTAAIQSYVRPGSVALDIGAHIGYHTLMLAKCTAPKGKVIAFEPWPQNFQVLAENVALNGYTDVVLVQKAVMDRPARVRLKPNDAGALTCTASVTSGAGFEVEAVSLDAGLGGWLSGERVAFIKIDAEGAEAAILDGMRETLRRDRPVLLVELHGYDSHGESHPVLNKLREAGYAVRPLGGLGAQAHFLADPKT